MGDQIHQCGLEELRQFRTNVLGITGRQWTILMAFGGLGQETVFKLIY